MKSLDGGGVMISEPEALQAHITDFYTRLFGSELTSAFRLHSGLWRDNSKVSPEDNEELTKPSKIRGGG